MHTINITIIQDEQGDVRRLILPDDKAIAYILEGLVEKLELPIKANEDYLLLYNLERGGTREKLDQSKTLQESMVNACDILYLVSEKSPKALNQPTQVSLFDELDTGFYSKSKKIKSEFNDIIVASIETTLVPTHMVDRLEENRSDQMRWESIMYVFFGAMLGVFINLATQEKLVITKLSEILLAVFFLLALFMWNQARVSRNRADKIKAKFLKHKK